MSNTNFVLQDISHTTRNESCFYVRDLTGRHQSLRRKETNVDGAHGLRSDHREAVQAMTRDCNISSY